MIKLWYFYKTGISNCLFVDYVAYEPQFTCSPLCIFVLAVSLYAEYSLISPLQNMWSLFFFFVTHPPNSSVFLSPPCWQTHFDTPSSHFGPNWGVFYVYFLGNYLWFLFQSGLDNELLLTLMLNSTLIFFSLLTTHVHPFSPMQICHLLDHWLPHSKGLTSIVTQLSLISSQSLFFLQQEILFSFYGTWIDSDPNLPWQRKIKRTLLCNSLCHFLMSTSA